MWSIPDFSPPYTLGKLSSLSQIQPNMWEFFTPLKETFLISSTGFPPTSVLLVKFTDGNVPAPLCKPYCCPTGGNYLHHKTEADTLFLHIKETTESQLKLHRKTPAPVVFFLDGRLPGEAQLHLKQLTIFGMICRLCGKVLNTVAHHLLTWKEIWKNTCKAHVTNFWHINISYKYIYIIIHDIYNNTPWIICNHGQMLICNYD